MILDRLPAQGGLGDQLLVQEDRVDDVEEVFPDLEVSHHCHLFDLHFQDLLMGIESYRKSLFFSPLVVRHEGVSTQGRAVYGWTSSITDSEQFLHAQMLLAAQSELQQLRPTGEVVLVDVLVVEGARIDLKELLADTGAL